MIELSTFTFFRPTAAILVGYRLSNTARLVEHLDFSATVARTLSRIR